MAWYFFHWTPRTLAKLGDRELTAEEYEEVICDPAYEYTSQSSGHHIAEGRTSTGRYMLCVYEHLGPDDVLPIKMCIRRVDGVPLLDRPVVITP